MRTFASSARKKLSKSEIYRVFQTSCRHSNRLIDETCLYNPYVRRSDTAHSTAANRLNARRDASSLPRQALEKRDSGLNPSSCSHHLTEAKAALEHSFIGQQIMKLFDEFTFIEADTYPAKFSLQTRRKAWNYEG